MASFTSLISSFVKDVGGFAKNLTKPSANKIAAVAYGVTGLAAGGYLDHLAGVKRNYYGDKEYEGRYNSGLEKAATLSRVAGAVFGIQALGRVDPIGLGLRTARSGALVGAIGLRAVNKAALPALGAIGRAFKPTGSLGQELALLFNPATAPLKAPQLAIFGTAAGAGAASNIAQRTLFKLSQGAKINKYIAGAAGLTALNLGAAYAGLYNPKTAAGIGLGVAIGGTGLAVEKLFGKEWAIGTMGVMTAGLTAGAIAASSTPYGVGESRISDFQEDKNSTVRKMNFNTAGLVQALHHNRRG